MANPLSILLGGGSAAHSQREGQVAEASAQQNAPQPPQPQQTPVANNNPATGRPSFMNAVATSMPQAGQLAQSALAGQQQPQKSLLGA
jgi:hypothetical protein